MVDDIGEGNKSYDDLENNVVYMMGYKTWNQPPWIIGKTGCSRMEAEAW